MPAEIRIGTSGWNYPAGRGTWNGIFYPPRRPRGFDELRYYAERFDTVEVNSTFYRMPEPGMSARWIERTPAGFLFSVKLYQKFTHPDMYLAREGVSDWDLSRGDFDEFRRGVDPLAMAGRLAAILVQFPPSFHVQPETRDFLDWLLAALAEYPLAVELRHRSWSDEQADTAGRLAARRAAWVLIDEPKFSSSIRGTEVFSTDSLRSVPEVAGAIAKSTSGTESIASVENTSVPLYVRLHGRNAAAWWDHDESEDRYDYLYSRAELTPYAQIARRASSSGRRVLLYMNNHFSAKSVANAAVLKHELGQPLPGDYPPELVARYPDLSGLVVTWGLPL